MEYISVSDFARLHEVSERTVRNYCATGKIEGAFLTGKTWNIPADATLPRRGKAHASPLLKTLREQKQMRLTEGFIKELHGMLKNGTSDSRHEWFAVGEYKRLPNEVGGNETTSPEEVHREMQRLLKEYNAKSGKTLEDILDLHHRFECIHPFQDGNGRVGRLIMFKECLANGHVPFIITDELKMFYYRGLQQWPHIKGYLMDTCLTAQDNYKALLDYFKVRY